MVEKSSVNENLKKQHNIAYFCSTQKCEQGRQDDVAIRWIFPDLNKQEITFGQIESISNQCANIITQLDITTNDCVFMFMPKSPELYYFFLGALKVTAIAGILFSNFGEEALLDRLGDSQAKILLTTKGALRKIKLIWDKLPALEKILISDIDEHESEKVLSLPKLLSNASKDFVIPPTDPESPSVIHYTSGSTGKPKGVLHKHRSLIRHQDTFQNILNVNTGDIFWCTADPGWVTGVSYGIFAPLSMGITQIQYSGAFEPKVWFDILQDEQVTVWYTAPTALRMLMQEDDSLYKRYDLRHLRDIFSVGEPLNPSVIFWARNVLGKEIYDTWFQTETGAIMIANRPGLKIYPGSMGKPYKVEAVILDDDNVPVPFEETGRLCLKPGWDSMFINYLNKEEVYRQKFSSGYYDTGDVAYQDEKGYFWFFGRGDDVINTSGHLVGPFEIESALIEMDEVLEVGVIGAPDEILYQKVVAYIKLNNGVEWSKELELKLRLQVSNKLSSVATPQEFILVESIPKNKSGKIMRRLLLSWYLDEDPGDISTLEK
jgi:acetyl-CoA synthetase